MVCSQDYYPIRCDSRNPMNKLIMETGRGESVFFRFNSSFAPKSGLFDQMLNDVGHFIKCSLLETVR